MFFVVIFTDDVELSELRIAHLQAHIDWLEQHQAIVPIGGSLRRELGEVPKGGLRIANAPSNRRWRHCLRRLHFFWRDYGKF
jgi:uncharacterized protein YciI